MPDDNIDDGKDKPHTISTERSGIKCRNKFGGFDDVVTDTTRLDLVPYRTA